jgi:hypothetical protein
MLALAVFDTVVEVAYTHQLLRFNTFVMVNIKVPCWRYWVGDNCVTCTAVCTKG